MSQYGRPDQAEKRYAASFDVDNVIQRILFGSKEVNRYNYRLHSAPQNIGLEALLDPSTIDFTDPYTHEQITKTYNAFGFIVKREATE